MALVLRDIYDLFRALNPTLEFFPPAQLTAFRDVRAYDAGFTVQGSGFLKACWSFSTGLATLQTE